MPTATLIVNDANFREELAEDENGELQLSRRYLVDTIDKFAALGADGLPALGESLGGAYGTLVVRGRRIEQARANDTIVAIEYTTPRFGGGSAVRPTPDLLYSELGNQSGSATVYYSVEGAMDPFAGEIPNGATVGTYESLVTVVHHRTTPLPYGTALAARPEDTSNIQLVNSTPIKVPERYGRNGFITFEAGQVRLVSISETLEGGVWITRFVLSVAPNHRHYYKLISPETGQPTGSLQSRDVYPSANLTALWPQPEPEPDPEP